MQQACARAVGGGAARRRGLKAWAFELADGPEGDLTKPAVLRRIRRAAKRGQIVELARKLWRLWATWRPLPRKLHRATT